MMNFLLVFQVVLLLFSFGFMCFSAYLADGKREKVKGEVCEGKGKVKETVKEENGKFSAKDLAEKERRMLIREQQILNNLMNYNGDVQDDLIDV